MSQSKTEAEIIEEAAEVIKQMREEDLEDRRRRQAEKRERKRAHRKRRFIPMFSSVPGVSKCCVTSLIRYNERKTIHCSRCMKLHYVKDF